MKPRLTPAVVPSPNLRAFSFHHRPFQQDKLWDLCQCMAPFRAGPGNLASQVTWHFPTMLGIFPLSSRIPQHLCEMPRRGPMGVGGGQGKYVF